MNLQTLRWLPLVALLPLTSGCLAVHKVDVRKGLARYDAQAVEAAELLDRPITIYIVAKPSLAGVVIETSDPEAAKSLGSYRSELFPIDEGEDAKAQIEARIEEKEGDVLCGLEVEGFSETLARLLRKRLGERFKNVEVRVVTHLDASKGVVVTAEAETYMEVVPTSDKKSLVRLSADLEKGAILVKGEGSKHVHRGHLIWAVPTGLVSAATLGPAGLMAIQLGLMSLEGSALEDSLVQSIDQAARKLAERLAEQPDQPVPLEFGEVSP